jgi:predicted RND superfamily exporter protein
VERLAGLYAKLARFALRRGRAVLLVSALLLVVSAILGLPPKVDSNLLNLLPERDPSVIAIKRINDEEGGVNVLTLSFSGSDDAQLEAFLDDLTLRFSALPDVLFAIHEVEPQLATQIGLLQLDPSELRKLSGRLKGALALGSAATNPMIAAPLMDMGPITEKIQKATSASLVSGGEGRGKIIVRPKIPASDPIFARGFLNEVRTLLAEVDAPDDGIELLWMGGAYRHTVEDVEGIQKDLLYTNGFSVLALVLILAIGFRSVRTLGILLPPIFVANGITLAFASFAFGSLNTYTSFGTAILFGLGIDYSVHLVGRYRENRLAGLPVEEAMAESWALTGPPCTTAAVTTAAGFVALTVAEFKGFAQLGLLLAVGLMLCLIFNLIMLPPLLAWIEPNPKPVLGAAGARVDARIPAYRWAPPLVVVTSVLTIVLGVWAIPNIGFEYDLSELRRDGLAYSELSDLERELARESYAPVVITYREGERSADLLREQAALEAKVAAGEAPHIGAVVSLKRALPADQAERNLAIAELVAMLDSPNLRYLPPVLVKRLLPLRGLEVQEITREKLPPALLHLMGATRDDVERMLVFPKGNMWDVREAQQISEEIRAALPEGREVAGEQLGVASMYLYALRDTPRMVTLVLLLVVLLTWLDLRRITWTFGALGALGAGAVWATAVLHGMGLKLSMVNLTGIPILLGMGVDVVVHLSHRMKDEGPGGIGHALRTTGVAAGISTATNAASFGSLMMAGNRGVRSLGLLVGVGLTVLTIVSVGLLAALWAWGWRFRPNAPRASEP